MSPTLRVLATSASAATATAFLASRSRLLAVAAGIVAAIVVSSATAESPTVGGIIGSPRLPMFVGKAGAIALVTLVLLGRGKALAIVAATASGYALAKFLPGTGAQT